MTRRTVARLAPALVALAGAALYLGAGPLDDDYIIFRYAERFVAGEGWTYGDGARVEGYTQPLWLMLITLATWLGVAGPTASTVLSVASAVACVAAVDAYWRRRVPGAAWSPPAWLLALSAPLAMHAAAGLGTTLLAALLALWLAAWGRAEARGAGWWTPAAVLGLAGLARPEAALFAAPFAWLLWRRRRTPVGLVAFAPLAAWTAFRLAYYGRLLPVTYHVKKLPPLADLRFGAVYLAESTVTTSIGVLVVLAAAWLFARRRELATHERGVAAGLLLHVAYVVWVGGDYMPYGRFFVPALPLAWTLACLAVPRLAVGRRWIVRAAAAFALAATLAQHAWRGAALEAHRRHEERWIAVGRALGDALPEDASVAVSAIGAIGYHSRAPIVDVLGLTNDELHRREPNLDVDLKGHQRFDAEWVLDQEPDVILLGSAVADPETGGPTAYRWEAELLAAPRLEAEYAPYALPVPGSYPLTFLLRRGSPEPVGAVSLAGRR